MDRTIVNLASILLGGAGLFTVLTGFNVPETTRAFWGENPFAIKRDAIENAMDWIFSGVALLALVLQLGAEILGDRLQQTRHHPVWYGQISIVGLVGVIALVWSLSAIGRRVARRRWIPRVINAQNDLFKRAAAIVRNDGFNDEELAELASYHPSLKEERRTTNFAQARRDLSQIEKLFELDAEGDLPGRLETVRLRLDCLSKRYPADVHDAP